MDARERYEELAGDLAARHDDVELGKMFGMPCVKRGGKIVAGFSRAEEAMVFKLTDGDRRESALALEGAHLFDPSGQGRAMREWVVVPPAHADEWPAWAEAAAGVAL